MAIYTYIGISIVVLLLLGFVTLSVIWVSRTVWKNIHLRTLELLSDYDELIDRRSNMLGRLEDDLNKANTIKENAEKVIVHKGEHAVAPSFIVRAAERVSTAQYRNNNVGYLYKKIKGAIEQTPDEIISKLPRGGAGEKGGTATWLLEEIPYDIIFSLSTLEQKYQYKLLVDTIPEEGKEILEEYVKGRRKFSALEFYTHLIELAGEEPKPTKIHVAKGTKLNFQPANSIIIEDDEICEGLEIEMDNKLYDYAIKAREIG